MSNPLPEETRKMLFCMLVDLQDGGLSVGDSRRQVAAEFHTTGEAVLEIEREGIENQWHPLAPLEG